MRMPMKFVAVLAAVGVMIVLITPAPDELPCTLGHKLAPLPALLATATVGLVQLIGVTQRPAPVADRLFLAGDVLSLSCTFLC